MIGRAIGWPCRTTQSSRCSAAAPRKAAVVAFRPAAATGARRAELAALRWDDIRGKTLTIGAQIVVHRRGRRGNPRPPVLERDSTKTRRIRTVTLDPGTLQLLDEWRAEHGGLRPDARLLA